MKLPLVKVGVVTCLATGLLFGQAVPGFGQGALHVSAEESIKFDNPSYQVINQYLTEAALEANIPPEVVKAVAKKESDWRQFVNGEPFKSEDNGYGIMQITNFAGFEGREDLIKTDIKENIKAGVEILSSMYDRQDLPKIKNAERYHLESWYFPVMAYNGIKPVNSPLVQDTGKRNTSAYQEQIFSFIIKDQGMPNELLSQLPFTTADFEYEQGSSENIEFKQREYTVDNLHESAYLLKENDRVVVIGDQVNLRERPRTGEAEITKLEEGTVLNITGSFVYDIRPEQQNPFVYYPVQTVDGSYKGYIASNYIKAAGEETIPVSNFSDVVGTRYQAAVDFLVSRGIKGKGDNLFGTKENIKRVDAAVMLARAAGLDIENAPPSGFTDVRESAEKEVNALKAAGITDGFTETTFNANALITRGDLAIWIQRAYELQGDSSSLLFNDIPHERYVKPIAALVSNGVTNGTTDVTFGTRDYAKRGDYALFLYRAANATK